MKFQAHFYPNFLFHNFLDLSLFVLKYSDQTEDVIECSLVSLHNQKPKEWKHCLLIENNKNTGDNLQINAFPLKRKHKVFC